LNKRIGDADQLDLTYAADVWTSASVDVRASASPMRLFKCARGDTTSV
jgi:hypothetical protein